MVPVTCDVWIHVHFHIMADYITPSDPDYNQDLNMLCMMNAGERSLDEFIALGSEANCYFRNMELILCGFQQRSGRPRVCSALGLCGERYGRV